ncbi:MAG TPA: acetylornithine deacetylase [Thermoanaerobaculia bacterium]|jgi:acetylornithine deacetylase|nr:acetylornithine deacetylase [Thermoanaerobaculia bacterium]
MPLLSDAGLLGRLIAFDTTSRNSNLPLADFLCDYLDRPGIRLSRVPSAVGDKTNLVAWIGPEPTGDRRGLVLSGHMDVVPAEEDGWTSDPFTLTDDGYRWVARGSCDMKGFLTLATNLAAEAVTATWRAPLALVFTYDEEVGTLGAKRLTESFPEAAALPRSAIIGEPTSLRVVRTHKGHFKLRVILHGVSAHSGYPHLGTNAIEPAGRVIGALAALRRELEAETPLNRELFPEVPFVPLNVGTVHGGSAINVVPDRCVVEVGVRPLPGITSAELIERVDRAVRFAAEPFKPEIQLLSDSPPLLLDEAALIHRHLCALVGQTDGASVSFATDAGWLQRLGLDCAIFGPGSIEVAHKPNEYLPKTEFAAARELMARTIHHFCETGN